ncbi:MAG: phosphodiester glycosidase family protein [Myxococcota bacterium]
MRILKLLSLLLSFLTFSIESHSIDCTPPDCTKLELKKGIVWYHKIYSNLLGGPQDINIVDIDNNDPHIIIKPVYKSSSSCEKISSMGKRTSAIAGINGGFFDANNGCAPLGLLKIDNKVISYAVSTRPARSAVGIQIDKTILFRRTDYKDSFPEAIHALGGMPNLVKDGQKYVTTSEEQADSIAGVNPRTAICKTPNNHFMMITVDGRATGRTGMSLDGLAQYLLWLGCSDGINLDGGGSTTMWISNKGVVNNPSDGTERYVSNGLFVFYLDNLPPSIEHTPISESERKDITILAMVTDDYGVKAVNLKFKNKDDINFISRNMTDRGNNNFEAIIYADEITTEKIQYYIAAWDGTLRTLLPSDAESNNHYFEITIKDTADAGYDIIEVRDIGVANDTEDTYFEYDSQDTANIDYTTIDVDSDIGLDDRIIYDSHIEDSTHGDMINIYDVSDGGETLTDSFEVNDYFTSDKINLSDTKTRDIGETDDLSSDTEESHSGCACNMVE